ncbi:hypothetical protein KIPB_000924 [Kipferlia bialata]|uniref:Uncharacterized protein n=1 Tax=Kipferlia bialata TaxID=797122 RepID=A0A391NLJ0_9EUKA|nr:hypothetical protein KIPB_000924 [Kipferlia bialata]|eukprot:g924.t1
MLWSTQRLTIQCSCVSVILFLPHTDSGYLRVLEEFCHSIVSKPLSWPHCQSLCASVYNNSLARKQGTCSDSGDILRLFASSSGMETNTALFSASVFGLYWQVANGNTLTL